MKTRLAFCGLLAACCLLLLTGCRSPLQAPCLATEDPETRPPPATMGTLLLTINEQGSGRTIMPSWPARDDFVEFRLDFSAVDNDTGLPDFSRTLTGSGRVELYPGIWEMDVTAYLYGLDGGPLRPTAIGTLAEPITVIAGETLTRNVMLFPISAGTGTGTFSWDISFPESVATARMEIARREGSAWLPHSTHFFAGGTPQVGTEAGLNLPLGLYRVVFALYMEAATANERAAFSTILHVYQNMVSHFQFAFTYDHFPLWDTDGNRLVPGVSLAEQLAWLRINAQSGGSYLVEITGDEDISPALAALPAGRTDVRITLRGIGEPRTVSLSENGSLFSVGSGLTLVLDEYVTLLGRSEGGNGGENNTASLVQVDSGGILEMNAGARITGNNGFSLGPGGVFVNHGGTFIMNGGTISGNNAWFGGGVYVGGTFTMHGGEISNNAIIDFWHGGGGVYVSQGTFTMYDGKISGNVSNNFTSGGGGVCIDGGMFTMYGGEISDNISRGFSGGGGVSIEGGTFTMHGGTISGNSANGNGGGVFVSGATAFDMRGGTIYGNYANGNGGGVFVQAGNTFRISDGVIYGNEAEHGDRGNAVSGNGAALYNNGTAQHGTFANGVFSMLGNLTTESRTIEVRDGVLIRPFYDSFVHIQGGTFLMGSPGNFYEEPLREVTLSGFYMSRFQVTQGEWYEVMGTRPSFFTGETDFDGNPVTGVNWRNLPVERVSWYDAIVFSNRLSIQRGLSPAYSINGSTNPDDWGPVPVPPPWNDPIWDTVETVPGSTGYRLPTEAQWEFAARGGIVCQGNYTFSGSNTAANVAWYDGNSGRRTHEVGTLQPNALGLYDMSGNLWEWVWDWFGMYPDFPETDPVGASWGVFRVNRGGDWFGSSGQLRSTRRNGAYLANQSFDIGFRLVRPFPPLQGTVSITGTPQVGQTLTANTANLGGSGAISFQWRRGGVNVGANSDTYVVQADDLGHTITVTVIRADNSGSYTSPAVGPVTAPGMIARRFDGRDGTRFTNDNWPAGRVNGFDYEAWTDIRGAEGFVMYIYTDGSFRGTWNQTYDTLFRVGRRWPGNVNSPTTFPTVNDVGNISLRHRTTAFASTNGATYLTVYGWAFDGNNQIEFYIIDSWRHWAPVDNNGNARLGYTHHGSFLSGGYTWDVVTGWRISQPALTGQEVNFLQIFSVRRGSQLTGGTGERTSTINVSDHFNRWITNVPAQTHGGTTINFTGSSRLYEVMWCVEGFGGMAGSSGIGIVTELCIIYGTNRVCTNPSTCPRC